MRELLTVFRGNEISVGIILFSWLILTSAGAAVAGLRWKQCTPTVSLAVIQSLFACTLPLSLVIIRAGPDLLGLVPGETAGFPSLVLLTLLALAPVCIMAGSLYTLACRAAGTVDPDVIAAPRIYYAETAGACLGGLVFSILLINKVPAASMIATLSTLNFWAALRCIPRGGEHGLRTRGPAAAAMLAALSVLWFYTLSGGPLLNRAPGIGRTLVSKDTPYSRITVKQLDDQYTFYQNGIAAFTVPDRMQAEQSVHIPLLEHPAPRTVLLLGGALSGSIREALRHPYIQRIDYIEQDPSLTAIAREVLPPSETDILDNPAVHLHHTDARRFIRRTPIVYDAVISNLPPPGTAGLNRFYTREFFSEVRRILSPDGLFSLTLPASENALSNEQAELLAVIHATMRVVFPQVILIPGEPVHLIASAGTGHLTADPDTLLQRLKQRQLQTIYVREYYLPYQLSIERRDALQQRLHPVSRRELNRDFKPVGYFVYSLLFSSYFPGYYQTLLIHVRPVASAFPVILPALAVCIAGLLIILKRRRPDRSRTAGIYLSILSVGFSEISLEFILILGFQVLYGSAYQELAVIIAGYMLGLMLGSRSVTAGNGLFAGRRHLARFVLFQLLMGLYPLFLLLLLLVLARHGSALPGGPFISSVFGLLTLAAGYIGGVQFPLANCILIPAGESGPKVAGHLYSMDLAGSAAGALITAVLLVPLLGIVTVLGMLALVNLSLYLVLRIVTGHKNTRTRASLQGPG
ncbi:hypothetical protein JXO52_00750 [bacterium]|nr:hypothetical protein [bacterium]